MSHCDVDDRSSRGADRDNCIDHVATTKSRARVIVLGPSIHEIGGMASVVKQMLSLDFEDRYQLTPLPFTQSDDPCESKGRKVVRHAKHLVRLSRTLDRASVGLLHIHTCSGFSFFRSIADMLVARRVGFPVILHIHGASFDEFYRSASWPTRRAITWGLTIANRVVALSQVWKQTLHEMAPDASIEVIENAVELPKNVANRKSDGTCRFLLLARMDAWKGIDDLLDACSMLHERGSSFHVTLAGPPGTAGNASQLGEKIRLRRLQGCVEYVGPVEGVAKEELLRRTDVYVQPSHHEGMPISLLEAFAHGLPVVATRVGAVGEVITDGREGLLTPPHAPDHLAESMARVSENHHVRRGMSGSARLLAESRFGLSRFRADLMALYDGLSQPTRQTLLYHGHTHMGTARSAG